MLANSERIKHVDPITYIDKDDPPFLIIHGNRDCTVPPNQSEALHAELQSCGVPSRLHVIAGAGHGGPEFSRPQINPMKSDFLRQLLPDDD